MQLVFRILAVAGPAMFAGVMLTIGVILGGYWKSLPPTEFLDWFAQHSGLVKRAIPLVSYRIGLRFGFSSACLGFGIRRFSTIIAKHDGGRLGWCFGIRD